MSALTVIGIGGAALVAIGLYGLIIGADGLKRILAFNILGGGMFLVFGVIARRGAAGGFAGDPVPQALVITGIVVAFAATALAVALLNRLAAADGAEASESGAGHDSGKGGGG